MDRKAKQVAIFDQLSDAGKIEVLAYANTVLKAEKGIKKQYGLDKQPQKPRKTATAFII